VAIQSESAAVLVAGNKFEIAALVRISAEDDVIEGALELDAGLACHGQASAQGRE
jgi:hypothetical protein